MSDLLVVLERQLPGFKIEFDQAEPYRPFDQLSYILPRASLSLLPEIYSKVLLEDPRSVKYYPDKMEDFEPFDGIHDYQWIAKLELFNTTEMNQVLTKITPAMLSEKDQYRNSRNKELVYKFDADQKPIKVKSTLKGLPDFEDRISITEFNLKAVYPFDEALMTTSTTGLDMHDGFPSIYFIKNVYGKLQEVNRRAKYKRLMLMIDQPKDDNLYRGYKGYVFYDYPFKKVGYVNTIVDKNGVYQVGNLSSVSVETVIRDKRAVRPDNVHKEVENDSTNILYKEKGIDYLVHKDTEIFYELEYRKSAWRTAMDLKGKIIYEFDHVDEIFPHGLLVPFTKEESLSYNTQFRFPLNEEDLFKPKFAGLSLENGDMFDISSKPGTETSINVNVYHACPYPPKDLFNTKELLEDQWRLIDSQMLKELGLADNQVLILFGIMDSFVIKTDSSKTSSLILGGLFDIGLRIIKALDQTENRLMIVTDLVR